MPQPRLVLVSQQFLGTRSGVGSYARHLALGLAARGLRARIATWSSEIDHQVETPWLDLGTQPTADPTPGAFHTLGRRAAAALETLDGVDLVHFVDAREAYVAVRRRRGTEPALVGTVHDDYAARAPATPFALFGRAADPLRRWLYYAWLRRLERRCYRGLDHLFTNAVATGNVVADAYGIARERFQRIHLGIAPEPAQARDVVELTGSPALVFAGGNFYRKGLDTVVLALARADLGAAHLHVFGHDPAAGRIRALAARASVADRVTLHGRVDRETMAASMAAADVFVMPSRTEAFGLVYLEAPRAGTPVVSGNVGGVAELVRDGESGLTVAPEDPDALARAILRIHRDPELAQRLVHGGRAVLAEHTVERMVDETLAGYATALGRSLL